MAIPDITHDSPPLDMAQRNWLDIVQEVEGVGMWSMQQDEIHWTESTYDVFGVPLGRFDGTLDSQLEIIHPDDRELVRQAINDALAAPGHIPFDLEHRIVLPSGEVRWVAEHGRYFPSVGNGQLLGLVKDLSADLKIRAELQTATERYRALAEFAGDSIFIIDRDGLIQYVNRAATIWIGHQAHEIVGKSAAELFDAETSKRQSESLRSVFSTGESVLIEAPNIVGGQTRYLSTRLSPIRSANGNVIAVLGVSRDTTEHTTGQRRFQAIVDHIDAAVLLLDKAGRTFYASPRTKDILGYEPAEYVAHDQSLSDPWIDFPPGDREEVERQFDVVMQNPGHSFTATHPFRRKDDSLAKISFVWINLLNDPALNGIMVIIHDISKETELSHTLEQAERIGHFGSYELDVRNDRWLSSPNMDSIFGIDSSYARTTTTWADLIHPDDRSDMLRYFQNEVLKQKKPFDKEYRIVRKSDGESRTVHGWGRLVEDAQRNVSAMIGVIQDVTELREAQRAQARADELERINRIMVDRELQMLKLKERIREMEAERAPQS